MSLRLNASDPTAVPGGATAPQPSAAASDGGGADGGFAILLDLGAPLPQPPSAPSQVDSASSGAVTKDTPAAALPRLRKGLNEDVTAGATAAPVFHPVVSLSEVSVQTPASESRSLDLTGQGVATESISAGASTSPVEASHASAVVPVQPDVVATPSLAESDAAPQAARRQTAPLQGARAQLTDQQNVSQSAAPDRAIAEAVRAAVAPSVPQDVQTSPNSTAPSSAPQTPRPGLRESPVAASSDAASDGSKPLTVDPNAAPFSPAEPPQTLTGTAARTAPNQPATPAPVSALPLRAATAHASFGPAGIATTSTQDARELRAPDASAQAATGDPGFDGTVTVAVGTPQGSGTGDDSGASQSSGDKDTSPGPQSRRAAVGTAVAADDAATRFGMGGWIATSHSAQVTAETPAATPVPSSDAMAQLQVDHIASGSAARRLRNALQSDLQFGVQTDAFGRVHVQTSMRGDQLLSHISVEHAHAGTAVLSAQMPGLETRLNERFHVNASVSVRAESNSTSGGGASPQRDSGRQPSSTTYNNALPAGVRFAAPVPGTTVLSAAAPGAGRLDVTI